MKCAVCGVESDDILVLASNWAPVSFGKCPACREAGKDPPGWSREEALARSQKFVPAGTPSLNVEEQNGVIVYCVRFSEQDRQEFIGSWQWGDGKPKVFSRESQMEEDERIVDTAERMLADGDIPIDAESVRLARAEIDRRKAVIHA